MSEKMNYIAFIDLLGTTEFAQEEKKKFYSRLITFQETISNSCSLLAGEGRVYFFSDSAFIESKNLDKLIVYLRDVRRTLLEEGYYMKGAIGPGELQASDPHNSNLIKDTATRKLRKKTVIGHCFSDDVVPVYALQAGLKGIGIRVDEKLKTALEAKQLIVKSCYLPIENNRRAECFYDVRFDKGELENGVLNLFLRNFYITNAKSKKYGRYYIPFLISWINSTDFTNTEISLPTDSNASETIPLIFELLINHGAFEKHFADLVGIEYIYFALLNKIFGECESAKVKKKVFDHISARKKFVNRLGVLPSCVINNDSRKQFLESLSGKVTFVPSQSKI